MGSAVYDKVEAYHRVHGDDVSSELSRRKRYAAILSMIDACSWHTLLDVGCGERRLEPLVPCQYQGIDLLFGQNVMDWTETADFVVANGVTYLLPDEREARRLLAHCWSLATNTFVFTSLDVWSHYCEGELTLDPYETVRWANRIATGGVKLDLASKPGDFIIAMYR